ncbi:MAG: sugar phosphate isomerase/epimerase [Planctomycetaceae bacterium]|jgi:sugar phosphate isomerase/epimerase|nr:sugar phosphate isomerase/epimerase [Planctomycetaceae bacterium]
MEKWSVGVFASIDAGLGVSLEVARELGVKTVQLHTPHKNSRTPEKAKEFLAKLADYGIAITAVFCGFEGESYESIKITAETVGLVPPSTRAARLAEAKEIADFAKLLGVDAIGSHIGFVPHDTHSADYKDVVLVVRELCEHLKKNGQRLHLETGQESVEGLLDFIQIVAADNLFINFDPANLILYGIGDPLGALKKVGKYVRSVHCKDATATKGTPGIDWGAEVPFGKGEVNAEAFLQTLKDIGYEGPLTIEREIPQEPSRQKTEIGQAVNLIRSIQEKLEST